MYQLAFLMALSGSASGVGQYYEDCCTIQHAVAGMHDGKVVLKVYQAVQMPATATRYVTEKDKDGNPVQRAEQYTIMQHRVEVMDMQFEPERVKVLDSEGKQVPLTGLFTKPTRVLMSFDENAIDSTYRRVLRKDVLCVIVKGNAPSPAVGIPPAPAAAPAPAPKKMPATPPVKEPPKPPEPKIGSEPAPELIQVEAVAQPPQKIGPGQENPNPVAGPAPSLATAALDGKGDLSLQTAHGNIQTMKAHYDRTVDGVTKKVAVDVKITNFNMTERSMPVGAVQGFNTKGESITGDALLQRLRRPQSVLISPAGKVHPFWLEVFREDVLILMPPTIQPEAAPVPIYKSA